MTSSNTVNVSRALKENALLDGNRSRTAPDVVRETRQQVNAEGRRLEHALRARKAEEASQNRKRNKRRRTASMEGRHEAFMTARGWFKRHDWHLTHVGKIAARKERAAVLKARQDAIKERAAARA